MQTIGSPFSFLGGVHPQYHKNLSSGSPIRELPLPAKLVVPMSMHLGAPAKPVVKVGDVVKAGQLIAEAGGFISAPVHAPAAGKVTAFTTALTAPGRPCAAIEIETSAEQAWELMPAIADWRKADRAALVARVGDAGIVGMGGAGFPTKVKLSPPTDKPIDTVIINGAECEPYLTADHRMLVEHAAEIREGAEIIRYVLNAKRIRFAIEDNKPDAVSAIEAACKGIEGDVAVVRLPTRYPQGSEKQQIFAVTGREVPRGGLPMDTGCVVENASTTFAIRDAVVNGKPLTSRVLTVTGDAVRQPANLLVPFGVTYGALVEACGGFGERAAKVISGGPMMGFCVATLDVPNGKTTSGVLCLTAGSVSNFTSQACISCGRCVDACPMRLIPSEISQFIEADDIDGAVGVSLMDCIECGSCAYVCPAHRPLVQHFRRGKAVVVAKRAAERAAAKAAAPAPASPAK